MPQARARQTIDAPLIAARLPVLYVNLPRCVAGGAPNRFIIRQTETVVVADVQRAQGLRQATFARAFQA